MVRLTLAALVILSALPATPPAATVQRVDLAGQLAARKLRPVNRETTPLAGTHPGVHVSEGAGPGVVWIEGTEFSNGTIELDVRGRDVQQRSFLGVAFHRKDDQTYEAVYLRPFNFRAPEPNHQHAIQYISLPEYDWPRLRQEFPEEFENPVDASVAPTDWVALKIVVTGARVQIFVGSAAGPALDVRKLGTLTGGGIGLWVGNNSDGDFANLRVSAG